MRWRKVGRVSLVSSGSQLKRLTANLPIEVSSSRPDATLVTPHPLTQTDHPLHPQPGYCAVWGVAPLQPVIFTDRNQILQRYEACCPARSPTATTQ
eukprot:1149653-Pelagomonas_calceolata.AAC.1